MLNEYINNLKFGLKDFNKTNEKYEGYKNKSFKEFLKENKEYINVYLYDLEGNIVYECKRGKKHYFFENYKPETKTIIRMFKTAVNDVTAQLNKDMIKYLLDDINNNNLRIFNIKFYLHYYKKINKIMLGALKAVVKYYK